MISYSSLRRIQERKHSYFYSTNRLNQCPIKFHGRDLRITTANLKAISRTAVSQSEGRQTTLVAYWQHCLSSYTRPLCRPVTRHQTPGLCLSSLSNPCLNMHARARPHSPRVSVTPAQDSTCHALSDTRGPGLTPDLCAYRRSAPKRSTLWGMWPTWSSTTLNAHAGRHSYDCWYLELSSALAVRSVHFFFFFCHRGMTGYILDTATQGVNGQCGALNELPLIK